ncbi:MAG: phosphatase PAP2 family protein, partial [Lachnospiraceae bacterium]|nr:phosphatase PAP2 family protein [Lachnospiraceae bacterium]
GRGAHKASEAGERRLYTTLSLFSFAVIPLVMLSRNYLGVHTFADVVTGLAIGIVILILTDRMLSVMDKAGEEQTDTGKRCENSLELIFCITASVIVFLPMLRYGCLSNAGGAYGLIWGIFFERRFVSFKTDASPLKKTVRFLPGAAVVFFCFTSGTPVMAHIVPEKYAGFFLQAFAGFFIMFLYPAVFKAWEEGKYQKRIAYVTASLLLILITAGCFKMIRNMYAESENGKIKIIAHRGYSGAAPENTLSAFARAVEAGPDMIETDVQMTKDGILVLFHDDDIGRITGCTGQISDYTYEELLNMDFGAWFDENQSFKGEKIPTLAEALEQIRKSDLSIYLELKDISGAAGLSEEQKEKFPEMVAKEVDEHGMKGRIIYASFQYDYLKKFKALSKKNKTLLNTVEGDAGILLNEYPSDYYGMGRDAVSGEAVEKLHEAGKTVYVWTVNTPEDMQSVTDLGVDGIVTNEPEMALNLYNTAGQ